MLGQAPELDGRRARRTGLEITTRTFGATTVVACRGEIDLASAPELEAFLACALSAHPGRLVVDLRKVSFMGVVGLEVLAATSQRCYAIGVTFELNAGQAVRKVLALAGMEELLGGRPAPLPALCPRPGRIGAPGPRLTEMEWPAPGPESNWG